MKRGVLLLALCLVALRAEAGHPCEDQPLTVDQIVRGMALAQQTAKALEASGADVVVLARAGQDLSEYKLQWSHLGFAYRDTDADGHPVWRVLHKLNICATDHGGLYRQGLGQFFLDRPFRYEAAFEVPTPELQQALLPVLRDNARAAALNEPRYSMVAYPWATKYQQSNQWAIETLAATQPGVYNRTQAQAWLRAHGYQPTDLRLSTLQRLGADVAMTNVAFDDHPNARRFTGHIETVTVDSVFDWLPRVGYASTVQRIELTP